MTLTDKQYLDNKIIEDTIYDITEDKVYIHTDNTSCVRMKKEDRLPTKIELLQSYKEIIYQAKAMGCKICYRDKTKRTILETYDQAILDLQELDQRFVKIIALAKQIEQRKLHYGYSDDVVFNDLTKNHIWPYEDFARNSAYVKIKQIQYQLNDLNRDFKQLNYGERITKLWL